MHGGDAELLAFLALLAGSLLMPILSGRLRVPSAILLILYGFAAGPVGLAAVHDDRVVGFLSEVGFIILMFMAGLEIDFGEIARRGVRPLLLMLAVCLGTMGLAFLGAHLLGLPPIYGLALAAMSVGMPLAILNETGLLRSPLGQTVVLVGSIGEFLTIVGMTLYYFLSLYGLSLELVLGLGKLVGVLLVSAFTLRTLMAAAWWWPGLLTRIGRDHGGAQIGLRAALLLMMAFSMMALLAGVEAIVGAFTAGAVIAFVFRGKHVLEEKLAVVGHGLFVPIFFIVVGVRFDPSAVSWQSLALAGELLLAAFLVKGIPSLLLLGTGLGLRDTLATALLLSAPLTLVVAIAAIGLELGHASGRHVLGHGGAGALVVLAVASGVVYPVLFRLVAGRPAARRRGLAEREAGDVGAGEGA